jgi:hypothetical protein
MTQCQCWCAGKYGAHGVTVNTEACGAFDSGSIPDEHPDLGITDS